MAPQAMMDNQAALLAKKFQWSSEKFKKVEGFIRWLPAPSALELVTSVPYRLENNLLPSLRHRITAMSVLLEPDELSKDPSEKWQAALKLLAELDGALEEIKNSVDSMLWNSEPVQDHQKLVTSTRCEDLRGVIGRLSGTVASLCDHYAAFVADYKGPVVSAVHSRRQDVLQSTAVAWRVIDEAIQWLRRSDFEVMQEGLRKTVQLIDDALRELMELFDPVSIEHMGPKLSPSGDGGTESGVDEEVPNDGAPEQGGANDAPSDQGGHGSSDEEGVLDHTEALDERDHLSEEETARAKLAIPLLRLIRLFVNKISKQTNSGPKMCSHMIPSQLVSLLKAVNTASAHTDDLVCALGNLPHDSLEITKAVTSLMSDAADIIKLINEYVDMATCTRSAPSAITTPSIPPTSSMLPPPVSLTDPKDAVSVSAIEVFESELKWCRVWGDQFHQAALAILDTCDDQ